MFYNIKKNNKKIIIILSFLGLIPFIFPFIQIKKFNFFGTISVEFSILYGITILCFLSGIYWGIGISYSFKKFSHCYMYCLFSMIPFFLALFSFYLKNFNNILPLILGFIICQILDENLFKINFYDKWYLILRRILTFIVVTILFFIYIKYNNAK